MWLQPRFSVSSWPADRDVPVTNQNTQTYFIRQIYLAKLAFILPVPTSDSSVGIATACGLDVPGTESRWGARFSAHVQTGPGTHTASCTMDTGSFPGEKSGRGVTLTSHPLLVPWSRKSRAIPLLPLWAVRPVQSLIACTRVHFTFTFTHFRKSRFFPATV